MLGTPELSWRDLLVIIHKAPLGSAVHRAMDPDADWDLRNHLLAEVVDSLHAANWQRSGSSANRPEPVPRPGVRPERENYQPMTVEETLDWLGWPNPN